MTHKNPLNSTKKPTKTHKIRKSPEKICGLTNVPKPTKNHKIFVGFCDILWVFFCGLPTLASALGWATHSGLVGGVGGFLKISSILMVGVGGGGLIFKKSMVGVGGWWVEDFFDKNFTKI